MCSSNLDININLRPQSQSYSDSTPQETSSAPIRRAGDVAVVRVDVVLGVAAAADDY